MPEIFHLHVHCFNHTFNTHIEWWSENNGHLDKLLFANRVSNEKKKFSKFYIFVLENNLMMAQNKL